MPFTGNLKLKIVEASDLKPTQLSVRHSISKNQTLIDPFVSITIDDATINKTTAKSRTFKPVWNEVFDISLIEAKNLQLTVFHKSAFSNDEFVANCSLLFDDFYSQNHHGNIESDTWVSSFACQHWSYILVHFKGRPGAWREVAYYHRVV